MGRYFDDILRIESADLDLAGGEIKHLPIYAGVRVAGRSCSRALATSLPAVPP